MQVEKPDTAVPWKSSVPGSTGAPLRRMGKSRLAFDLQKGYTIPGAARRDPQCRWVDTCAGMGELALFHAAALFSFSEGSIALLFETRNTFLGVLISLYLELAKFLPPPNLWAPLESALRGIALTPGDAPQSGTTHRYHHLLYLHYQPHRSHRRRFR